MVGKKQLDQLAGFTASLLTYGAASFLGMVYFTDWRAIVPYIPYYNLRFKDEKRSSDS